MTQPQLSVREEWKDKISKTDKEGGFLVDVGDDHEPTDFDVDLMEEWVVSKIALVQEEKIKAIRDIFYSFYDNEKDFDCNQKVLKLRNDVIKILKQ